MKELTSEWLKNAKLDLLTIEKILDSDLLTGVIAFHAQQTMEKIFKAVLEENNIEIPKIHGLIRLYVLSQEFFKIILDLNMLKTLDSLYISTRYPSDFALLPDGKPSMKEAKEFYNFALSFYEQVKCVLEN